MKHYIALDLSSEVTTSRVETSRGAMVSEGLLRTSAESLIGLVKSVGRPRVVVFEEGSQAAWVHSVLLRYCDEVIVCNPAETKRLLKKSKGDKVDPKSLAKLARAGLVSPVWHGGESLRSLREALRMYQCLTKDCTITKNRLRAVFKSQGIRVSRAIYREGPREEAMRKLPLDSQRLRVDLLAKQLETICGLRKEAKAHLISLAKKQAMFKVIKAQDGMGDVLTSMAVAEVGDARRFRTRSQFWSYCGLSIVTDETGEYGYDEEQGFHKKREWVRTKGLAKTCNRTLKYVFKDVAKRLSTTKWKREYQRLLTSGVRPENARTTLARKAASITLHLAKTGEQYDITRVFKSEQISQQHVASA